MLQCKAKVRKNQRMMNGRERTWRASIWNCAVVGRGLPYQQRREGEDQFDSIPFRFPLRSVASPSRAPPGGAAAGVARRGREGDAEDREGAAGGWSGGGDAGGGRRRARRRDGVGWSRRVSVACVRCVRVCGVRGRAGLTVRGYAECPRSGTRHSSFFIFFIFSKGLLARQWACTKTLPSVFYKTLGKEILYRVLYRNTRQTTLIFYVYL